MDRPRLPSSRGKRLEETINSKIEKCVTRSGLTGDHPLLDGSLHGTSQHTLSYEFEKLYRRFFQPGSKKRYAGHIIWKEGKDVDEMDMVGFESQRSDTPELTADAQPEVVNRILDGQGFDEVSEYIQSLIAAIEDGSMERYRIALPQSLGQPLGEYGNTQTARACRYSNENLGGNWGQGDDPWLYFIKKTPPMTPATDVIALTWDEDIPDEYELDMDRTLERALEKPLRPILDEVGWKFTELKNGAQTQSAASGDWGQYESSDNEEETNEWGW